MYCTHKRIQEDASSLPPEHIRLRMHSQTSTSVLCRFHGVGIMAAFTHGKCSIRRLMCSRSLPSSFRQVRQRRLWDVCFAEDLYSAAHRRLLALAAGLERGGKMVWIKTWCLTRDFRDLQHPRCARLFPRYLEAALNTVEGNDLDAAYRDLWPAKHVRLPELSMRVGWTLFEGLIMER